MAAKEGEMGRRGTKVTDPELPVVLTPTALLERGQQLASMEGDVERAEDKLKLDRAEFNSRPDAVTFNQEQRRQRKFIRERKAQIRDLAQVIRNQEEFRDQSTLTFVEDPTKQVEPTPAEAQRALAVVAEVAGETAAAAEEDVRAKCVGCGTVLSALEVVKKLGLCEGCQVSKGGEVELPKAAEPAAVKALKGALSKRKGNGRSVMGQGR